MHCYFCHGYSGDGRTAASRYLEPRPRNFMTTGMDELTRAQMFTVVRDGKAGTAMMSFSRQLSASDITAVVDYVRINFMRNRAGNTRYHTVANGWLNFERYAPAFDFVSGKLAIDAADDELSAQQLAGKRLFLSVCITCHEGHSKNSRALDFDPRAVSYPRGGYSNKQKQVDAVSGATPYTSHERRPELTGMTAQERQGETLFQQNCAFCHAADGTGKNWIGSFLEPHPRNLTDRQAMANMDRQRLVNVIRSGVAGTTMSAWQSVLTNEQIDAIAAYVMKAYIRTED